MRVAFANELSYGRLPSQSSRARLVGHLAAAQGDPLALDVLARIIGGTLAAAERVVAELRWKVAGLAEPNEVEQLVAQLRAVARAWNYLPLRTTPLFRSQEDRQLVDSIADESQ